jgi:hypothetical protein
MAARHEQTSLITILSSEHGRLRRTQRDISKRDLQKALKHGTRERSGGCWKVEYDGIIFITDINMRREVTAFPSPLAFAPIEADDQTAHDKAKIVIKRKVGLCVSHTVLVVDNSGSMRTHDINLHRDRHTAAYSATALEFIAEQIFNGTANNSDVVSLVEFSRDATVVFSREPVSWVLYNKLLARRDSRNYKARDAARIFDAVHCDSNYLPAIKAARGLLAEDNHESCALSMFFLSDGAPTDARYLGLTLPAAQRHMCTQMEDIALEFGKQLNVTMVGFGEARQDFSALESMVQAVNVVPGEANAAFVYCDKLSYAIGAAITSLVTSLTTTRTSLMDNGLRRGLTQRCVALEKDAPGTAEWKFYRIADHYFFNPRSNQWDNCPGEPPGSWRESDQEEVKKRKCPPPFLALNTRGIDTGVERIAFRCKLSDKDNPASFVLGPMVAKETKHIERIEAHVDFHKSFCKTQDLAAYLALNFNARLRALPHFSEKTTPRIAFLPCTVLLLDDPSWPQGRRGVLVEKELDTGRYGWCKWNTNAGHVDGRVAHVPIDVEYELKKLDHNALGVIEEGDSEDGDDMSCEGSDGNFQGGDSEEEDDMSCEGSDSTFQDIAQQAIESEGSSEITKPSDYLQAFTHFTYLFTDRKVMVCDLQGVFNTDMVPPTFELSDPAIHYSSKRGRDMVYGLTDKGRKGVQLFFNTHKW